MQNNENNTNCEPKPECQKSLLYSRNSLRKTQEI